MAITALAAIAVGRQIIQGASWVSTVVFIRDTGARVPAPPLWDMVAVVAMGLLVWWIWYELPGRSQVSAPQNAGSVSTEPEPTIELKQEISELKAKLGQVATVDAKLHAENIRLVDQIYALRTESAAHVAKIHQELFEARAQLADANNQLHRQEQQRTEEAAKQRQRAELLEQAPQLLIQYSNAGSIETLEFINDGPNAVVGVDVGPLTWKEDRVIGLRSQLPPIPPRNREAVQICFQDSPHSTTHMDTFVRSTIPPDASSVSVNYQNPGGTLFVRDFLLKSFPDGRLVWNPGPVRLQN